MSEITKKTSTRQGRRPMEKRGLAPDKLKLLITVVNREKAELYEDFLQQFQINLHLTFAAKGTATGDILQLLGLAQTDKAVIVSVIREDMAKQALSFLEEKFKTVKNGKGIAYTIPLSSTIGVAIYQFLSNQRKQF